MNNHRQSYMLFSFLLIFILVIGSFMVLIFESKGYSSIVNDINTYEDNYLPMSYISTKCQQATNITISKINNTNCLVLDNNNMKTYIYYQNGYLKEINALNSYNINLVSGTNLFEIDKYNIKNNNTYIIISINNNELYIKE